MSIDSKDKNSGYVNSDPRRSALYAISRIDSGAFSNIIINDILTKGSFSPKDRALFSALTRGVTERRITLDYIIDLLSSLPSQKIDADARNILRLGIYQLAFMDAIPQHAAVNECVSLARKRSKGFINALLRTFIRNGCKFELPEEPIRRMSVEYSASEELCRRFTEIFGYERAKSIFAATFGGRTDICVNTLKIGREELSEKIRELGFCADHGALSPRCIKTDAPYSLLEENFRGLFFVMDEASQVCGEVLGMKKGESLCDICSAPGSKSFYAALSMQNTGEIFSFDLHKSKISLIRSGAERLGIDIINAAEADGSVNIPEFVRRFDCVLCDVPCSGLGVFSGKPEIKYKKLSDFVPLPDIQQRIVQNAASYVSPGGRLIYSTCTLLPEENEENVKRFLQANPDFALEPFTVGEVSSDGMLTLTPDNMMTDGFFIAKIRRAE